MPLTRARPVFPLPIFELPRQPGSGSRRLWQRYNQSVAVSQSANHTIYSLNHLSTSFRSAFDHYSREAGNFSQSSVQNRMMSHIYRCASRFVSRRGTLVSECDDPLFDQTYLTERLRRSDLDAYISKEKATIVPIIADRVSLPTAPGTVELLSILPPKLAQTYERPNDSLFRPPAERPRAPRTKLHAEQSEWEKVVTRMKDAGMLGFTTRPKVVCGVFAVPKDEMVDRLIIDARPANSVFVEPDPVKLPTPDLLANLCVDPSRRLFVAKVDLDNFYHRLRLPEWMRPYFALPPVRASAIGLADEFGCDTMVYPCCATLPMGWSHSVLLAQLAHEHVLNTLTSLSPAGRITETNDSVVDRLRHQVYIDDLNIFGYDVDEVRHVQDEYIHVVESLGLIVKPTKVVRPTSAGVECVGLEVDGEAHTVGVSAAKLERLREDTFVALSAESMTGHDLSRLVGRWTWAALACRPALSVFSAVYRFIECAAGRTFRVWNSVRNELWTMMGLCPLLFTDIGSDWFERVVATDASDTGQGVVTTVADPSDVTSAEAAVEVAEQNDWYTIVSSRWRAPEHINVLELRALTTAVRWVCSHPSAMGHRILILSDSQVVIGAVSKGRSSSPALLRRLRHLTTWVLAAGLRLKLLWIPTASNPADGPSRC